MLVDTYRFTSPFSIFIRVHWYVHMFMGDLVLVTCIFVHVSIRYLVFVPFGYMRLYVTITFSNQM